MALGLLVLPAAGHSQESADNGDLEEVVVYAQVPLTHLRGEVQLAEDSYFAKFNELNSTDEHDILCRMVAPTGTHIKQRQCRARFMVSLEHQAANAWRYGQVQTPQQWIASRQPLIDEKARLIEQEMRTLLLEHPELLRELNEVGAANERFDAERARRCAGRIFFCRR